MSIKREQMEKHMTFWQEEKQTEEDIKYSIKRTEDKYNGKYISHSQEKFLNQILGKDVWLLGVVVDTDK